MEKTQGMMVGSTCTDNCFINVPFQTWQAKSLLAKSKLLPQITYNAHTYPLNKTSRRLLETEFLNYLTNNPTISLSMRSLQETDK